MRDGALAGAHEQISTNFRSNPQLLRGAQRRVRPVLRGRARAYSPATSQLDDRRPTPQPAKRPPIVLVVGGLDSTGSADELRARGGARVAALLHTAHEERWEIRDRRDGGPLASRAAGATWRS